MGPEVKFFCASHEIGSEEKRAGKTIYKSIVVEDGAWIGANTTIFPRVTVSTGDIVGACSVLTKSTEKNRLYYGSPAKEIKEL